jgi:methyl-accepting chemotaxis protein
VQKLKDGDTSSTIPYRDRSDVIGDMGRSVEALRAALAERATLAADNEARSRQQAEAAARISAVAGDLQGLVSRSTQGVAATSAQLRAAADRVRQAAEESARQLGAATHSSSNSADGVRTAAAAAEELSSVISDISRQVQQGSKVTAEAVEAMQSTRELISALDGSSARIGEVVTLITGIAEQTNLLALNATIEAARAGEAGRGFAVVAQEVKQLANQTSRATEDIRRQVDEMQAATRQAVSAMGGIGETIRSIDGITISIASAVEEQNAATQEIARAIGEAASASSAVTSAIQVIDRAAADTVQAAGELETAADGVLGMASGLRDDVDRELNRLKAA